MDIKTFSNQLLSRIDQQVEALKNMEYGELALTAKIIPVIRESIYGGYRLQALPNRCITTSSLSAEE